MDCLELNIHQRILADLASKNDDDVKQDTTPTKELIAAKVQTRIVEEPENGEADSEGNRVYMTASRVHCNIAFGEFVVNFPTVQLGKSKDRILSALLDILRDVPFIDFDPSLSWHDWALPDQLVFSTVSALLRLSYEDSKRSEQATSAIFDFVNQLVENITKSTSFSILTQLFPAFHGLYRAIISTSYNWNIHQWNTLTLSLKRLCSPAIIDRLNRLFLDIVQKEHEDTETIAYTQTFLNRYTAQSRPLSGYFMICCILETEWTVLAQTMTEGVVNNANIREAAAANKAWGALSRNPAVPLDIEDGTTKKTLKESFAYSMQCFTEIMVQIEEMDSDPEFDTYAWETMSESLKLASVCCIALQEIDDQLHKRILLLLSGRSPISDNLVQEAALKATTILVRSFPAIASDMTGHLRKFVTSPLPLFQFEFAAETRAPPPLAAAAKCLAICIRLAPGDDLIMSNMYSLLNYIAATSKEIYDTTIFDFQGDSSHLEKKLRSLESGLRDLSDDEKHLIGISTISVVTRLALEFQMEEVTRLTISMLLQRLRSAEPTVEAAIAYNLVDLALIAPSAAFADIIRAFSAINRSANPDDPRFSNNMVLAAQTRLAQELNRRAELYEQYLIELLTLFADKGVAIQNLKITNPQVKIDDMIEQLASLLLPIDALLRQSDFDPADNASPTMLTHFRNTWFLCVLFDFTHVAEKESTALEWIGPALARIALKTPATVVEESLDAVASDVEYSSVIRQEYAHTVIASHRALLHHHLPMRHSEVRHLSSGQVVFVLAMYDVEKMRSAAGRPSSLVHYFTNDSLNEAPTLIKCMESVAENVIRGCIHDLNTKAAQQTMPKCLSDELRSLLILSTHRVEQARDVASKYLNRLITSFPSLMCDPQLVFAILEVLTLLQRSCESEFLDEYNPIYEYHSDRSDITLQLTDSYGVRKQILGQLRKYSKAWLDLALNRAPMDLQSSLQKYLAVSRSSSSTEAAELGASLAEQFGRTISPGHRHLVSLSGLSKLPVDGAKTLASQLAIKGYYAGESAGIRLSVSSDQLANPPPQHTPVEMVDALRRDMKQATKDIRDKKSVLTVHDLRRLLYRCAAVLISQKESKSDYELLYHLVTLPFAVATPSAIAAAVEVWNWMIAENPYIEVALISEIGAAWTETIAHERGIFSQSLNYQDPFYHAISYSPTNKETIDRASAHARRILSPQTMVLKMLFSRLQASRYHRPAIVILIQQLVLRSAFACQSMSNHALAREVRFSFLLFGFETLKSSSLDAYCEHVLRESLYKTAFAWFAVRPQFSFGANRVQVDADIKVCSEFLSALNSDSVRGLPSISSLSPVQLVSRSAYYVERLKNISLPLRLLCEDEIHRLSVWSNPLNDTERSPDIVGSTEKTVLESSWPGIMRTVWQINPAVAVFCLERFRHATIRYELAKLLRSGAGSILDVPDALPLLLGDRLDPNMRRDIKHVLLWAPVTPVLAVTFFEPRYNNDPVLLQYANRVMAQHPVDLTFFFIPQVVQALRHDDLGYVARFIFETAKISQLFCHQIIWNMKANCFKDDAAEVEDPMKPKLDEMTAMVVDSLSGEARSFYDREFNFFNEVTSISGKLKPYIKKTKPEKKAKIDEEMAKLVVDVGVYLPSNPDGVVVDIDKKSGRPLQSHAKAPFMATFKVRKERVEVKIDPDSLLDGDGGGVETIVEYDVWQQAIFKVGDDCRQDVLALQVIAMFKNIFESVGITLYLFPYRVTATAPGCGVIDVVPNATSRDEMGRAKVNDLLDFFVAKYGGQNTVSFQTARLNFIQSMAAYSVACYILQIKDRHNGNIMIDGEGHIVHIDFGFLFDIGPGGIKFEPSSFKLNHEMILLMGGRYSQGYQLFQSLAVKAFLAIRPYSNQIVDTVQLMLETGLPSFKGEGTIRRLRDRFAPGLGERQATEWIMGVIKNAHENVRSTVYDEFQRLQNGIPYK
ncbi:atypical/PIKK/PI4K protein kinase [Coprinopsis marcescibilis]|uniref:1-phosphatidylinositol 4-kinase n=1 Tax=Coprinopsis marcescibilis TaxID=230819 RepID=A0A5C3LBN6_COPMA|nr:atypical/PIKK/PI4K protein kinase [Coprinopsis marcescibilis]